ncbi:MAG: hypothetical protein ABEJ30_08105 [Halorientalis sp.]
MSPTLRELQDVLDWRAVEVLRAVDERQGATAAAVRTTTDLDDETVADRCQQLETLGLLAVHDDGEPTYEVTGAGHSAIGAGLYDEYDLVDADVGALAETAADLLDRRDDLADELEQLRADAEAFHERATRQFGDREDVTAEVEALVAEVEALAERLAE